MKRILNIFSSQFESDAECRGVLADHGFISATLLNDGNGDTRWIKLDITMISPDPLLSQMSCKEPKLFTREELAYERRELDDALLLDLSIDSAEDDIITNNGVGWDVQNACPGCLSGARAVSRVDLNSKKLPNRGDARNDFRAILFHERVVAAIEDVVGNRLDFQPSRDARTREPCAWHIVSPRTILPRLHPSTRGVVDESRPPRCAMCDRSGHVHTVKVAFEPRIGSADITGPMPRIASTWECFGIGNRGANKFCPPIPMLVVSQAVRQALLRLKVSRLRWTPITIV